MQVQQRNAETIEHNAQHNVNEHSAMRFLLTNVMLETKAAHRAS